MSRAAALFARWRVRLGYVLAVVILWLARPTPRSIVVGGLVGILGLWIRGYAAGYLHKQSVLTVSGPYAHTRNPLYLGSSVLALGTAVAIRSWISAAIIVAYFAIVYPIVMGREAEELRAQHGVEYDSYAAAVPLFFPRMAAARLSESKTGAFSWAQYKKNHEYEAAVGYLLLLGVLLVIWRLRFG